MSIKTRVAVAVGVLFLAVAALATFLPSSSPTANSSCGSWVAPEVTRESASDTITEAEKIHQGWADLEGQYGANDAEAAQGQAEAVELAQGYAAWFRECDETLSTRRTIAVVSLILGAVVVGSIMFAVPSRKTVI